MTTVEERKEFLKTAEEYKKTWESKLRPTEELDPNDPAVFISAGGGEIGDLAMTAATRQLGGQTGGVKTVVFDRYEGFPAQDAADAFECFDMMDGDLLEEKIKKHVPDPSKPHAIYLEIEMVNTRKACQLGVDEGYRVLSSPYGPLICMDRHLTKLMFDKIDIPRVEWGYATSQEEIDKIAKDFGLPLVIKPVMTSSGHGTTIAKTEAELKKAYDFSVKHARGGGEEVTVEKFMPELTQGGTEITQLVVRHFDENGKIVSSLAPPIEHQRPGATYHESWLPATISEEAVKKCHEGAKKIAEFAGGLGIYAIEQFVFGDEVYNNEVANRPHDTGMVSKWMMNMDEGALQLHAGLGLPITPSDLEISRDLYGVAHVILAPEFGTDDEVPVVSWNAGAVKNYIRQKGLSGDIWYFGKPVAYSDRRMGLAVAFDKDIGAARKVAEEIAHVAEQNIVYKI